MKHFAIAVAILLGSSGCAMAHHNPPHILEGKTLMQVMPCTLNETNQSGICALFIGEDEVPYLGFKTMDGVIRFIRKITKDGYEDVYVHGQIQA